MMRQGTSVLIVTVAVALLLDAAAARQPAEVRDKVVVRNAAKKDGSTTTLEGKLTLTPAGLQVLSGTKFEKATRIAFGDIVRFEPGDLPGVNRDDMLAQQKNEAAQTRKDFEAARAGYATMLKKAASAPEATRRYLEYRVAMMSTRIADESSDDEKWDELAAAAAKEWASFLTGYKSGWEVWPAARANARLLTELNRHGEAAKLWGRMAKSTDLPPDMRLEAGLNEIDAYIRAKGFSAAASLAETLGKTTAPGADRDKLAIYERAARAAEGGLKEDTARAVAAEIEKKIAATRDPSVRGVGFSMIGELYLLANKPRDAMWAFLWVETVYNADRDDVRQAMCRLADIFKSLTDEDRHSAYREKIRLLRDGL